MRPETPSRPETALEVGQPQGYLTLAEQSPVQNNGQTSPRSRSNPVPKQFISSLGFECYLVRISLGKFCSPDLIWLHLHTHPSSPSPYLIPVPELGSKSQDSNWCLDPPRTCSSKEEKTPFCLSSPCAAFLSFSHASTPAGHFRRQLGCDINQSIESQPVASSLFELPAARDPFQRPRRQSKIKKRAATIVRPARPYFFCTNCDLDSSFRHRFFSPSLRIPPFGPDNFFLRSHRQIPHATFPLLRALMAC